MSDQTSSTKVGLFIFLGLVILCISILIFGGKQAFFEQYYNLNAKFVSPQGLARGSVVSLAGVEVGNVTHIGFDADGNLIAKLKIQQKVRERITTNALATIRTQGALGDKYIYILPNREIDLPKDNETLKKTQGLVLKDGDFIVTETSPDLFELISGRANDLQTVSETIREVNMFLHSLNTNERAGVVLESLIGAGQDTSKLVSNDALPESFRRLHSILSKIDDGKGTLGKLVNDGTLYDRLVGILGENQRDTYLKQLLRDAIRQNEKGQPAKN